MTQPVPAHIAPIPRRIIAFLIDGFIATALAIVLIGALVVAAALAGPDAAAATLLIGGPLVVLLLLAWFLVYTAMQAGAGSIGMRAQGLRLITASGLAPLGFRRALARNIVFWLACSIVVGYFTPLFDGSGRFQGWHDKAAGSLMQDAAPADSTAETDAAPAASPASAPVGAPRAAAGLRSGIASSTPAPAAPAGVASLATPAASVPAARAPAASAPERAAPAAPLDEGALIAFVPGVSRQGSSAPMTPADPELDATVQGSAAPVVAPAAAPVASAGQPAADTPVAVATHEPDEVEDTRISIPGHRLVFTWDDGTRVPVSRRTIFGRNPAPEEGASVVPVRDETLSLSKTHFEAAAESAGGWVLDRHSTNGMTLVREGRRIACPPGQRVPVRLGDAIEIGERIVTVGGYA
jgi:uncharacterized RDD family membrane protein YckC